MKQHNNKFRKWLLFLVGLFAWFVGIVLVIWLTLPRWLPPVIAHFSAPVEIDLKVREIGLDHSIVEDIDLKVDQLHLKAPRVSLTYFPRELISGQVETILLGDASLDLNLAETPSTANEQQAADEATPDLRSILNMPLPKIPVRELLVDHFTLNLIAESGKIVSPHLDLRANKTGARWGARADLELHDARVDIVAYDSRNEEDARGFEIAFDMPDPVSLLRQNASFLPDTTREPIESLPLEITGFSGALDWKQATDEINFQALLEQLKYGELVNADTIFLDAKSPDYLETLQATFFIQQLSLTGFGSTHVESEISAREMMSGMPRVEADLTITDIQLANALPIKVETMLEQGLALRSHVSFTQEEEPIQGVKSHSTVTIPASTVTFQISPEQQLRTGIDGKLDVTQEAERIEMVSSLRLSNLHYNDAIGLNLDGMAQCELRASISNILSLGAFDVFKSFATAGMRGNFSLQGDFAETSFSLNASAMEIHNMIEDGKNGFLGELHLDQAKWDIWELIKVDAQAKIWPESAEVKLAGQVLNPSLEAEVAYETNFAAATQTGQINIHTSSDTGRSTVQLQRFDATLPETIAEGILQAVASIGGTHENPALDLTLKLENGSMSMPGSDVALSGIQLPRFEIDDLLTGSGPAEQEIRIDEINFSSYRISDVRMVLDPLAGFGVNFRKFNFMFCGGKFEIDFDGPIEAPYTSFAFNLKFSGVDLLQLTRLIPDFKDEIEGRIEGHIPVVFRNGKVSWKEGYARLMEGTTCIMRYSKTGLVATYIPKIEISKKLDIDVNDALRDITVTKLDLKLRSSEQFSEPSVVIISGHSNNPKLEIPIEKIQLNIRAGDIPTILNETIQKSKWFEWLTIKGKMNEQLSATVK